MISTHKSFFFHLQSLPLKSRWKILAASFFCTFTNSLHLCSLKWSKSKLVTLSSSTLIHLFFFFNILLLKILSWFPHTVRTCSLQLQIRKAIHLTSYPAIWGAKVTGLCSHSSTCTESVVLFHSSLWFFNLLVAYFLCIWPSVSAQLVSTRTYAVKKEPHCRSRSGREKVFRCGLDWCRGWLLCVHHAADLPITQPEHQHAHTGKKKHNSFHPSFFVPLSYSSPSSLWDA